MRSILVAAVYALTMLSALIVNHRFDEYLPDGIYWIFPLSIFLTCLCVVISQLRIELLAISIALPIISPFIGGGPDMALPMTVIIFTISSGIGILAGLSICRLVRHLQELRMRD